MAFANFDRIARLYRWMEYASLGPWLQQTRTHFLPRIQDRRRAVLLGDGDGRFLARLLRQNPGLQAEAVDCSGAMLRLLRARAGEDGRVRTYQQCALEFCPHVPPDLVVTHFFLDCLTQAEVESLAGRLAASMAPGAFWLVSEFRIPCGAFRVPATVYIAGLYGLFRVLTGLRTNRLPDHAAALSHAGLILVAQRVRLLGLLTSELWQKR